MQPPNASYGPAYPRLDGRVLTGRLRIRFLLSLWRRGYPTVLAYQRRSAIAEIRCDGMVGPQTWEAFWYEHSDRTPSPPPYCRVHGCRGRWDDGRHNLCGRPSTDRRE